MEIYIVLYNWLFFKTKYYFLCIYMSWRYFPMILQRDGDFSFKRRVVFSWEDNVMKFGNVSVIFVINDFLNDEYFSQFMIKWVMFSIWPLLQKQQILSSMGIGAHCFRIFLWNDDNDWMMMLGWGWAWLWSNHYQGRSLSAIFTIIILIANKLFQIFASHDCTWI